MRTHALTLEDLAVESFATAEAPEQPTAMYVTTQWPMDCAETLPRFCPPTAFA